MGWDKARHAVFEWQQQMGIAPPGTQCTEPPRWTPYWETLSADEQRLSAPMMEAFAGSMSHTDHHFCRVIDFLEQIGELDNTIIVAFGRIIARQDTNNVPYTPVHRFPRTHKGRCAFRTLTSAREALH